MQICPSCGAQLPGGARFCGKCGHLADHARTARSHGAEEPVVQAHAPVDHPSPIKHHARQPYRYLPLLADAQPQPGVYPPPPASVPTLADAQPLQRSHRWESEARIQTDAHAAIYRARGKSSCGLCCFSSCY